MGHLEPTIENNDEEKNLDPHKNPDAHITSSVIIKKMMSEQVEPDAFELPCHKLKANIDTKPESLLKKYASQFARNKTSINTTLLTKMTIGIGNSEPVSQKPYPITMKHYQWVKD